MDGEVIDTTVPVYHIILIGCQLQSNCRTALSRDVSEGLVEGVGMKMGRDTDNFMSEKSLVPSLPIRAAGLLLGPVLFQNACSSSIRTSPAKLFRPFTVDLF